MRYLITILMLLCAVDSTAAIVAGDTAQFAPRPMHFYEDSAVASDGVGTDPRRDYEYEWTFGDATSGTWGTTGKSKNVAYGPEAFHLYESAGTYTVTVVVRDALTGDQVSTDTETVVVTDADTVFSSTDTICYSDTTDFTGCPANATQITTTDFSGVTLTDGDRHLFRRGASWTLSSSFPSTSGSGGTIIGAFGTCSNEDAMGLCDNAPHFNTSSTGFVDLEEKQNWRIMDLSFSGTLPPAGDDYVQRFARHSYIRLQIGDAAGYLGWGHNVATTDHITIDQMSVVECKSERTFDYGFYVGSERLAFVGNIGRQIDPSNTGSHVVRVWQTYRGVVQHNDLSGPGYPLDAPTLQRLALKMEGRGYRPAGAWGDETDEWCDESTNPGTNCLTHEMSFSTVSDNILGASGGTTVSVGAQDAVTDAYIHDMIFERNRFHGDHGYVFQSNIINQSLHLNLSRSEIRNNVFDVPTTQNEYYAIGLHAGDASPASEGNNVWNNTVYSRDSGGGLWFNAVYLYSGALDNTVRNNIASFPNLSGTANVLAVYDNGTGTISSNNALQSTNGFIDPDNATPLSRDFGLQATATYAIDAGYAVPVYRDFNEDVRGSSLDIGAFEYDSGAVCDADHLSLCDNETDCGTYGGYWYDSSCNASPEPTCETDMSYCDNATDCNTYWSYPYYYDGECQLTPESSGGTAAFAAGTATIGTGTATFVQ